MSTKKETTSKQETQFDPGSRGVYNALQPGIQNVLQQFMSDPLTASYFLKQLGMANQQISQLGQRNVGNLLANMRTGGFGGGNMNAFQQSALARTGRATSGMQSNAFNNLLMNANQMRLGATQQAQGYNPLVTGQTGTTTEKTSGLGTWLPTVLGAGLGIAAGFASGGATGSLGGRNVMGGGGGGFGSILGGGFGQFKPNAPGGGIMPGQGGFSLANLFNRP